MAEMLLKLNIVLDVVILREANMFIEVHSRENMDSLLINLAHIDSIGKDYKTGQATMYFANSDNICKLSESYETIVSIISRLQC